MMNRDSDWYHNSIADVHRMRGGAAFKAAPPFFQRRDAKENIMISWLYMSSKIFSNQVPRKKTVLCHRSGRVHQILVKRNCETKDVHSRFFTVPFRSIIFVLNRSEDIDHLRS